MRIGHGYDTHRLVSGRPLILGGVTIPYAKGLAGHSDADALLHALADAILGALAEGDIGRHFPDSAAEFKDIDSLILLRRVVQRMRDKGFALLNADATILAEAPKMAPHIPAMQQNIATALAVKPDQVNIKATTTEGMGPIGQGEGIAAHAVVLLSSIA